MDFIADLIATIGWRDILESAAAVAFFVWLAKSWIFSRLTESIKNEYAILLARMTESVKHEYADLLARLTESLKREYGAELQEHKRLQDEKLQEQKAALDAKLQQITHVNELGKLRTGLFFEHQQKAFQDILNHTAFTLQQWWKRYDPETYIVGQVPHEHYQALEVLIRKNQLFLDPDCTLVLGILMKVYSGSMPFDDGSGGPPHEPDGRKQLEDADFLQPRIASIFQMKIGVPYDRAAFADIALFGIVRFLQEHRLGCTDDWFKELLSDTLDAEDAVAYARARLPELSEILTAQLFHLEAEGWIANAKYKRLRQLKDAIKKPQDKPSPA